MLNNRARRSLLIMVSTLALLVLGCDGHDKTPLEGNPMFVTGDCDGLQSWVGNDWRLSFAAGEVIEYQGNKYQANVAVSYPNAECAPDSPVSWCANWFTYVGACGDDSTVPVATCSDGIQNQDEEGVDCGGSCTACAVEETCSDGIQNQDEEGVDCGGSCTACAVEETCSDGIQNQGEEGVDCGGPCTACSSSGNGTTIPAQIEAEDFDNYYDTTSGHSGDCGSGPVDMQTTSDTGGGCNVGWTKAGEWLEYNIVVPTSGQYDITLRLAAKSSKQVSVSIDGATVGTVTSPSSGWQSWSSKTVSGVNLNAGASTVRVTFVGGDTNLNWISFAEASGSGNPDDSTDYPAGDKDGYATRYWDCCKPHCAWSQNASNPVQTCDINNQSNGNNWDITSACDGGNAFTCYNMAPWAVSSNLSYGYAAVPVEGDICGKCYQLNFTGTGHYSNNDGATAVKDKVMIVMATNAGYDVSGGQFDLLIPGGGVGAFNGCSRQWGTSDLGATYGGFLSACNGDKDCVWSKCQQVFSQSGMQDLLDGCEWFVTWFEAADNPNLKYKEVTCPQELENIAY